MKESGCVERGWSLGVRLTESNVFLDADEMKGVLNWPTVVSDLTQWSRQVVPESGSSELEVMENNYNDNKYEDTYIAIKIISTV